MLGASGGGNGCSLSPWLMCIVSGRLITLRDDFDTHVHLPFQLSVSDRNKVGIHDRQKEVE